VRTGVRHLGRSRMVNPDSSNTVRSLEKNRLKMALMEKQVCSALARRQNSIYYENPHHETAGQATLSLEQKPRSAHNLLFP